MELVRRVGLSPNVRKKQIPLKGQIFGLPLVELTARCDNDAGIPNIVVQCANFIRQHGMREEGLFRVSGNRRIIDQLRNEYDQFGTADLNAVQDISVVTSVFKMFFRELPNPLITDDVSEEILSASEDKSLTIADLVAKVRGFCKNLPAINYSVLKYLCAFLNEVGQQEVDTKMSDSSLAIVFGPNLFRIKNDLEALQRQPAITKSMSCLITHNKQIFPEAEVIYSQVVKPLKSANLTVVEQAKMGENYTFILDQTREKENLHVPYDNRNLNKVAGSASKRGKDWDDAWLSDLAQDSPSPETEDILARSHDSMSSMSPLTASGNLTIQFNMQQTIRECIWEMLIPAPATSDHSFNVYHAKMEDHHQQRDNGTPSPSPRGVIDDRRGSDGVFNFTAPPLSSLTKNRASPQKRRHTAKPRSTGDSGSPIADNLVPKLNLNSLPKNESGSSLTTCQSDSFNLSPKRSPKTVSSASSIASLTSKIALLKQKVVDFDQAFEKTHGRVPSGNERRPIVSVIKELQELKRLLLDAKAVEQSRQKTSLGSQFSTISGKLEEKRKLAGRPLDLSLMSATQLNEEKLCIQKMLLHFEETYGRPKTKEQKDVMRPIYDRYRKVKLALNRSQTKGSSSGGTPNSKTPTGSTLPPPLNDTWNVTMASPAAVSGIELVNLSTEQLVWKLAELQESKKGLRKTLRDFEKEFLSKTGRKVFKEDRGPRENDYNEYKQIKARIRLVETLLKKNNGASQTI